MIIEFWWIEVKENINIQREPLEGIITETMLSEINFSALEGLMHDSVMNCSRAMSTAYLQVDSKPDITSPPLWHRQSRCNIFLLLM